MKNWDSLNSFFFASLDNTDALRDVRCWNSTLQYLRLVRTLSSDHDTFQIVQQSDVHTLHQTTVSDSCRLLFENLSLWDVHELHGVRDYALSPSYKNLTLIVRTDGGTQQSVLYFMVNMLCPVHLCVGFCQTNSRRERWVYWDSFLCVDLFLSDNVCFISSVPISSKNPRMTSPVIIRYVHFPFKITSTETKPNMDRRAHTLPPPSPLTKKRTRPTKLQYTRLVNRHTHSSIQRVKSQYIRKYKPRGDISNQVREGFLVSGPCV